MQASPAFSAPPPAAAAAAEPPTPPDRRRVYFKDAQVDFRSARRQAILQEQKARRRDFQLHARNLAAAAATSDEPSSPGPEPEPEAEPEAPAAGVGAGAGEEDEPRQVPAQQHQPRLWRQRPADASRGRGGSAAAAATGSAAGDRSGSGDMSGDGLEDGGEADEAGGSRRRYNESDRQRAVRQQFAEQLTAYTYLLEAPADLAQNWFCMPRPEGVRALVIASHGRTVSRKKNGARLHVFPSELPDGSRWTQARDGFCILDCVYTAASRTYWVLDLMAWKGMSLYDSPAEFRFLWLNQKLGELGQQPRSRRAFPFTFRVVPRSPCDSPRTLLQAYPRRPPLPPPTKDPCPAPADQENDAVLRALGFGGFGGGRRQGSQPAPASPASPPPPTPPPPQEILSQFGGFPQDGILFVHRHTHYEPGRHGTNPLAILWKDPGCSRFYVNRREDGGESDTLQAILRVYPDGSLRDAAGEVCQAGPLPAELVARYQVKPGDNLRFGADEIRMTPGGQVRLAGLRFLGPVSRSRVLPDSIDKLVFQQLARAQRTLPLEALLRSVEASQRGARRAPPPTVDGGGPGPTPAAASTGMDLEDEAGAPEDSPGP